MTIENVPLPVHSCSISNVTETRFTVTCKDGSTRLSSSQEKGKVAKTPLDGTVHSRMVQEEDTTHHVMEIYDAFRESLVLTLTTTRKNPSSPSSSSMTISSIQGGQGTRSHKGQDQILPSSIPPSGLSATTMSSSSLPSSSPFIIFKATELERNTTYILVIYSQNSRGKSSNVVTTVLTKSSSNASLQNSKLSTTDPKSSVAQNDDQHGTDYFQEHYYQGNILLGRSSSNDAIGKKTSTSDLSMIERIKGLKKSSASIFNRDILLGMEFFDTYVCALCLFRRRFSKEYA